MKTLAIGFGLMWLLTLATRRHLCMDGPPSIVLGALVAYGLGAMVLMLEAGGIH